MVRINKAIELLNSGQNAYYVSTNTFTFENGKDLAKTPADIIRLDLEHSPFDIIGVRDFMLGLVEGGPTKSGHRTPTVVAELPFDGEDDAVVRANHWVIKHLLATGIHGFILCHAESSLAIKSVVEGMRYSFVESDSKSGNVGGRRGYGGQNSAAKVWGVDPEAYLDLADLWPLNKTGELIFGIKLENTTAISNSAENVAVPGVCFAEWGPGDLGLSMGYRDQHDPPHPEDMLEMRSVVMQACRKQKKYFLDAAYDEPEIKKSIDEEVNIIRIPPEDLEGLLADYGRNYTKRSMAW